MAGDTLQRSSTEIRQRKIHVVKSWPNLFEATLDGSKKHDMRRAIDRDYMVGDILRMREFNPESKSYTGREIDVVITYITSAIFPCALSGEGLSEDYCILSIQLTAR